MDSREIIKAALRGFDVYGFYSVGIPISLWIEHEERDREWRTACKDMCKMYEIRFGEKDRDSVFAKAACDGLHRSKEGKPT